MFMSYVKLNCGVINIVVLTGLLLAELILDLENEDAQTQRSTCLD